MLEAPSQLRIADVRAVRESMRCLAETDEDVLVGALHAVAAQGQLAAATCAPACR